MTSLGGNLLLSSRSTDAIQMTHIVQINSNDYIKDTEGNLILDSINHEPIPLNKSLLIQQKVYNADSLIKYIEYSYNEKILATIPHNRQPFTKEILEEINNNSKSEIIIEIIKLLKFPEETQEYLLTLKDEHRKLIFNKYDNLLNNNISPEIINLDIIDNYINNTKKYNYILILLVLQIIYCNILLFLFFYNN